MINWARVNELKSDIGPDDIGEVVDLFLEEVEEVIARLRSGEHPGCLEQDMHFLKGSALNLGFDHLGSLCSDAEKKAAGGSAKAVLLAPVLSAYEQSKTEFMAVFTSAPS